MPERPPPLTVELSPAVARAVRRDRALMAALNAVLLRATRRLRARLDTGATSARIAGRREGIVLTVTLQPPDVCLVDSAGESMVGADKDVDIVV